jgi:hypothetical protein
MVLATTGYVKRGLGLTSKIKGIAVEVPRVVDTVPPALRKIPYYLRQDCRGEEGDEEIDASP